MLHTVKQIMANYVIIVILAYIYITLLDLNLPLSHRSMNDLLDVALPQALLNLQANRIQ